MRIPDIVTGVVTLITAAEIATMHLMCIGMRLAIT